MFDIKKALEPLYGMKWATGQEFRDTIRFVCKQHVKELPIEFVPDDLVKLIRKNGWLRTTEDDCLVVARLTDFSTGSPKAG